MFKKPFLNALAASTYIFLITQAMRWATQYFPKQDSPYSPLLFLSILCLSVAVMAYLFCLQPTILYLDGHKSKAIMLFTQTIAYFALFTFVIFVLLLTKTI